MKKILLALIITFLTFTNIFAYDLTAKDEKIIDRIEVKVFDIIDTNPKFSAEKVVNILEKYVEKKKLSERLEEILLTIIDDIKYEYYLWEYAEEDLENSDDYLKTNFTKENEAKFSEDIDNSSDEDISDVNDYSLDEFNNDNEEINEENTDDNAYEDSPIKIVADYKISWDNISLISGKDNKKYNDIFKIFTTLIPKKNRENLVWYRVYDNKDWDTYAYVSQTDDDESKWILVVNIATFYKNWKLDFKESVHTLIHEFTHTMTLSKTQVNLKIEDENFCKNYFISEWCLNKNAYLNEFIEKFWKNDFKKSQWDDDYDFYIWNENRFVTSYASSNPWEDIAETFTYFVIQDKPVYDKMVSDQKILFFWKHKELVKLRAKIRKGLKSLEK